MTGPVIYSPLQMFLQRLHFSSLILKPECWSSQGLNLGSPARQSDSQPTEPTGQRLCLLTCTAILPELKLSKC